MAASALKKLRQQALTRCSLDGLTLDAEGGMRVDVARCMGCGRVLRLPSSKARHVICGDCLAEKRKHMQTHTPAGQACALSDEDDGDDWYSYPSGE